MFVLKAEMEWIDIERTGVMIPKDPVIKLRDFYDNLDALCEDLDADRDEIVGKLSGIDYHYDEEKNQFV